MIESRNILYEVKKKNDERSSPFYNPIDPDSQIREQLKELRVKNRNQETQIIRLKAEAKDLRNKILFYQQQLKVNSESQQQQASKLVNQVSAIPMILQNKELKFQLDHIHDVNLSVNGKNRELEAQNRQLQSDLTRLKTKIKELEILEKVRSENYQKDLDDARPVIIQQNKDYELLTESIKKIMDFMREKVVSVAYQIFNVSAQECEHVKKTNSYSIFLNYLGQLSKSKHLGYLALLQSFKSLKEIEKFLEYDKSQKFDINSSEYRDTLNEWIIGSLTEIKMTKSSEKLKEQKLFRLLGLLYRSKFPIKGQKYQVDLDVKTYFEDFICAQIFSLMLN